MSFFYYLSLIIFMGVSAVLCLVVLIQESKSMGLGASFGGDPGESLFGTSTADVLKKFTAYLAIIFVVLCILLSWWSAGISRTAAPVIETIEQTTSS